MERKFKISVNGRHYDVTVEEVTEGTSYFLPRPGDMRVPDVAPPDPPESSRHQATDSGSGVLPSPLAGVIDSIAVAVGDRVDEGQALLIIDAMKMKTTIVANHTGTVARLLVSPGESVDGGQALLEIQ